MPQDKDTSDMDLGWSEEQIAGQRLVVGFDGTAMSDALEFLIRSLKVGGLILFSRNLGDPEQIADLCAEAQACAAECGQPPLIIAIDQEGGVVARLKEPFTQFAGNPHMTTREDAVRFARTTAQELSRLGVNMDMAPVIDVAEPLQTGIMADRAFGSDPQWVADMGRTVIEILQQNGIMAVAKHFPGIGRTRLDSHHDLPRLSSPLEVLEASDLLPFYAALRSRVAGIMLSHILYEQIDPQWPASLSPRLASDLLRRRMGYQGVVMTDDLDMGAIARHFDIHTVVDQLIAAEVDIVLICHAGPNIEAAYEHLLTRITRDTEALNRARESCRRIMRLKTAYIP